MFGAVSRALRRFDRRAYERRAPRLETDERGFTVRRRWRTPVTIRWEEIAGLVAWKRDELTTDLLCIAVDCPSRGGEYILHEDMLGYDAWQETMERVLSVDPAWWGKVIQPPFAPNVTTIYHRAPSPSART